MSESSENRSTARQSASYYDQLWSKASRELHYTEVDRAQFVVGSVRDFVRKDGLQILDLGCGRGMMAPCLSPLGSVTGIDFSSHGIQIARERYGEHANFVVTDADSPTLGLAADLQFDVVVCSEVIEHVPSPLALLQQVAMFLRPGGWCMLTTPNKHVWPQYSESMRSYLQPVENWLAPCQIRALFQKAGFRVIRHEGLVACEFRYGTIGWWLQRGRVKRLFRGLGLDHLYGRLVLPSALYQAVSAQKTS